MTTAAANRPLVKKPVSSWRSSRCGFGWSSTSAKVCACKGCETAPVTVDKPAQLIEKSMAEMAAVGDVVTVMQACRWAGVSSRSYYYQPTKAKPRANEHLAARVKRVITDLPYAGYRTVAWLLGEYKNTIQHLSQLKG